MAVWSGLSSAAHGAFVVIRLGVGGSRKGGCTVGPAGGLSPAVPHPTPALHASTPARHGPRAPAQRPMMMSKALTVLRGARRGGSRQAAGDAGAAGEGGGAAGQGESVLDKLVRAAIPPPPLPLSTPNRN